MIHLLQPDDSFSSTRCFTTRRRHGHIVVPEPGTCQLHAMGHGSSARPRSDISKAPTVKRDQGTAKQQQVSGIRDLRPSLRHHSGTGSARSRSKLFCALSGFLLVNEVLRWIICINRLVHGINRSIDNMNRSIHCIVWFIEGWGPGPGPGAAAARSGWGRLPRGPARAPAIIQPCYHFIRFCNLPSNNATTRRLMLVSIVECY